MGNAKSINLFDVIQNNQWSCMITIIMYLSFVMFLELISSFCMINVNHRAF